MIALWTVLVVLFVIHPSLAWYWWVGFGVAVTIDVVVMLYRKE